MVIRGDNTVAHEMTKESRLRDASKEMSMKYHFFRDVMQKEVIMVHYVS